jgi:drug/metabolite transporter (DMT)-like permease
MIWSLLGALILFPDERQLLRQPRFYLGMVLSVAGYLLISLPGDRAAFHSSVPGIVLVSICSLMFGLYAVSVRRFLPQRHPVFAFGVVAQLVSLGTLSGLAFRGDIGRLWTLHPSDWGLVVGSSVLGIALGHFLMYAAVQRLGAALTTSCQSLTPFVTAALASATLGESLSPTQWLAGWVMTAGALVLMMIESVVSPPASARIEPDRDGS